jgi:prepilin signal peptidase PulO-like enzyme (type II secretory pathway)
MSSQSILRFFLPRIVLGFLVGALYAGARYGSPVSGGLAGALCSASFISLERFVLRRNSGGFIRPLPFLAYFALVRSFTSASSYSSSLLSMRQRGLALRESGPSTSSLR